MNPKNKKTLSLLGFDPDLSGLGRCCFQSRQVGILPVPMYRGESGQADLQCPINSKIDHRLIKKDRSYAVDGKIGYNSGYESTKMHRI